MTLGEMIRRARTRRGWSLRHLADRSGLSPTFVSLVETNKQKTVGALTLDLLANVLDLEDVERARWFFAAKKLPPKVTDRLFSSEQTFVALVGYIESDRP